MRDGAKLEKQTGEHGATTDYRITYHVDGFG